MTSIQVTKQPYDPGVAAWNAILPPGPCYPALEKNQTADWVVIGAGFAGLSAARRLQQLHPNDTVALIEARRIGEGPAGRNSGFMIDLPHNLASQNYSGGANDDLAQIKANRHAIAFAIKAKEEFGFSKEAIIQSGKINAAATSKGNKHNLTYASHLADIGEHGELLDRKQMSEICGSDYYRSGLYTPGTAMLQPALYVRELAAGLAAKGLKIYENSPVNLMSKEGRGWKIRTPKGYLKTSKVILAVNGHAESFGFYQRRLMHIYLYGSITRPLSKSENKQLGGDPNWAFTPADPMGTTVRKIRTHDGTRIIVRNRFTWAPKRSVSDKKLSAASFVHERSFKARFPMLGDVTMEHSWGGLLCLSWNNVAAFGELDEGLYSACCQNGLGTAKGTFHGIMAAELASGQPSEQLTHLLTQPEPKRLPPEPFASIGANAYMRWGEYAAGADL